MKRWGGLLAVVLALGLLLPTAAEPSEPGDAGEEAAVALLTEPETLPRVWTLYRGDSRQKSDTAVWKDGYVGQAMQLTAGETLRLADLEIPPAFSLDVWVQWLAEESEALGDRRPTLLTLEGTPGFGLAAAGRDGAYVHSPLLEVTDAAGGTQTLSAEGTDGLADGLWHRLTVVGDAKGTRLYLDGMPVCETPISVTETVEKHDLCIGGSGAETGASLLVDEMYLYDRALTLAELSGNGQTAESDEEPWDPMASADHAAAPDPLQPHNRLWILALPGGAVVLLALSAWWRMKIQTRQ